MKIAIIGLGYVGIQLAVAFGRNYDTIGFDSDSRKIDLYSVGIDRSGELTSNQLLGSSRLVYSSDKDDLVGCEVFIIAVPTPIDDRKRPDFVPLISASKTVGSVLRKGNLVVYESTVYPGATEELCIPILEDSSGLKWKTDFHVGYSPERINPGDPDHTLSDIKKVISGDDKSTVDVLAELYSSIIPAGVHCASSIQVAEAAKVIENTQRDINIALVNELSLIFDKLGISTAEVLEVAATKWNFMHFKPGLVGGHCIGVDPYYLTHKARMVGYEPEVILSGRRINNRMGIFVADKTLELIPKTLKGNKCTVNVLGVAFKENCSDIRNSQVFSLIERLKSRGLEVAVADPMVNADAVSSEHKIEITPVDQLLPSCVLISAVPHKAFGSGEDLMRLLIQKPAVFIDIKATYRDSVAGIPGVTYWSL